MKLLLSFMLMLGLNVVLAQLRVSTEFITNLKSFSSPRSNLDINDLFARTDQIARIYGQYKISDTHEVWGQFDLDPGSKVIGFGLGYHYYMKRDLYAIASLQSNSYYIDYPRNVYPSFFEDHAFTQLGLGSGWRQQFAMFEFTMQGTFHFGSSSRKSIQFVRDSQTNLRTLESHEFHIRNIKSIRLNPQIRLQLSGPKTRIYLTYQFVWRVDWLKFENTYQFFEWTLNNLVESEQYAYPQRILHHQHHIGFTLDLNWRR